MGGRDLDPGSDRAFFADIFVGMNKSEHAAYMREYRQRHLGQVRANEMASYLRNRDKKIALMRSRYRRTRVLKTLSFDDPGRKSSIARNGGDIACRVCGSVFTPSQRKI